MPDRVVVRAPGTVANLGPGFDAMGLALSWYDEISVERADALEITASGAGAEGVRRDETNSIVVAMGRVLGEAPKVRIHKMTSVAFARGFGSSAISIVGGLVAARALEGTGHSDDDLLRIAVELEGHPDNVAPCLLGGVVIAAGDRIMRLAPHDAVRVVVCAAPTRLSTTTARGAVPETIPRADAVANLAHSAMLAASLATGRTDVLLEATEDRIHQPARFELMPDSGDLVSALRAKGIAAFLSGAGPSVSALIPFEEAEAAEATARALASDAWDIRVLRIDGEGATVVEQR